MRVNFSWEKEDDITEESIVQPIFLIKHITKYIKNKGHASEIS